MGIDIYMRWKGQTEAEEKAQYTGFAINAGDVGYLREAYHGGPYATRVLVREAFDAEDAQIPAATLRARLPETIKTVIERSQLVYKEVMYPDDPVCKAFADFVRLAEEKEKETGEPVTIQASW